MNVHEPSGRIRDSQRHQKAVYGAAFWIEQRFEYDGYGNPRSDKWNKIYCSQKFFAERDFVQQGREQERQHDGYRNLQEGKIKIVPQGSADFRVAHHTGIK